LDAQAKGIKKQNKKAHVPGPTVKLESQVKVEEKKKKENGLRGTIRKKHFHGK